MTILTSLGVNLGPLLDAGIAGVALGFGAQTIVRHTFSGVLILAENQFDVGDTVELQTSAQRVRDERGADAADHDGPRVQARSTLSRTGTSW